MKIAIVHNSYRLAGGEDAVVEREIALLRSHGHTVEPLEASSQEIGSGLISKVQVALELAYSEASRRKMAQFLSATRPDIVHVHNWFPLLTPSVYDACREQGVPVVQSLHNYRILCSNALLLRNGRPCEDCVTGSPYQGVLHGCYRDSRLATLPLARMIDHHRRQGTWNAKVDRFIALTEFSRDVFIRGGIAPQKISVKPGFTSDPGEPDPRSPSHALYVGRLSSEKGVRTLIRAWKSVAIPLHVIGGGPLAADLAQSAPANVRFLGEKSSAEVSRTMAEAAFLVVPSECYETFGMVVIEAFSHGLPVLVSGLGSPASLVAEGETGLHFKASDAESLARVATRLAEDTSQCEKMGREARRTYLQRYTPERNYQQLLEIYTETLRSASTSRVD